MHDADNELINHGTKATKGLSRLRVKDLPFIIGSGSKETRASQGAVINPERLGIKVFLESPFHTRFLKKRIFDYLDVKLL